MRPFSSPGRWTHVTGRRKTRGGSVIFGDLPHHLFGEPEVVIWRRVIHFPSLGLKGMEGSVMRYDLTNRLGSQMTNRRHGRIPSPRSVLATGLFAPSLASPGRPFVEPSGRRTPEQQLVAAVLLEAIHCFQRNCFGRDRRSRRLFREAEDWLMGEDANGTFSCANICEILGIDPAYLRCQLRRWQEGGPPHARARTPRSGGVGSDDGRTMTRSTQKVTGCGIPVE